MRKVISRKIAIIIVINNNKLWKNNRVDK